MWGSLGVNVKGFVGAALENVQKLSQDLEAEMNAAVSSSETQENEEKKSNTTTTVTEAEISSAGQSNQVIEPETYTQKKVDDNTNIEIKDDLIDILSMNETVEQKRPVEKKIRKNSRKQPPPSTNERSQSTNDIFPSPPDLPVEIIEVKPEELAVEEKSKEQEITSHKEIPNAIPETSSPEQVETVQLPQKSERVKPPKRGKKVKSSPDTIKETPIVQKLSTVEQRVTKGVEKDSNDVHEGISIQDHPIDDHHKLATESSPPSSQLSIEEYEIISTPPPPSLETQQTSVLQPILNDIPQEIDHQPQPQLEMKSHVNPLVIPEMTQELSDDPVLVPSESTTETTTDTGTHQKVQIYETKVEESHRHYFERKIELLHQEITSLTSQNEHLRQENKQQKILFENSNLKLSSQIKIEMNQLNEVIAERERALQSANVQLADLHQKHEDAMIKVMTLTAAATGEGNENKRELMRLQEILKEKEENLNAYAMEGQALSKKQVC
jgi:hypothetical protein